LLAVKPAAAIFSGPMRHGPALVAHALEPDALGFGGEFGVASAPKRVLVRGHRTTHLGWAVGFKPGASLLAKCFEVGHPRGVSTVKIVTPTIARKRRIAMGVQLEDIGHAAE